MLSGRRMADIDTSIARQMSDMIRAFRISQIVGTIAQLGIPDRLASGARTAGELASLIGCHAGATHRLMRAASNLGLVASGSDARFTLTALGQSLRSDVPGSVRDSAIALTAPGHWLPWGRLSVAVRTGRRQTVEALGAELFEYYSESPAEGRAFTKAMTVSSLEVAGEVARVLDTSSAKLVVDVGGASGALISSLLMKNPALMGAILERPEVVPRAQAAIAERGLASRCQVSDSERSVGDAFAACSRSSAACFLRAAQLGPCLAASAASSLAISASAFLLASASSAARLSSKALRRASDCARARSSGKRLAASSTALMLRAWNALLVMLSPLISITASGGSAWNCSRVRSLAETAAGAVGFSSAMAMTGAVDASPAATATMSFHPTTVLHIPDTTTSQTRQRQYGTPSGPVMNMWPE